MNHIFFCLFGLIFAHTVSGHNEPFEETDPNDEYVRQYHGAALYSAMEAGQKEAVAILLEHGADPNTKDWDNCNRTALHLAVQKESMEMVKLLIEKGADVSVVDCHGSTPLHLAVQEENREMVKLLIEKGVNINAAARADLHTGAHGTPLHIAVQKESMEMMRLLIEEGANVSAPDHYGLTALHLAVQKENMETVRLLIEEGADVSAADRYGLTALHIAAKHNLTAFIEMPEINENEDLINAQTYGRTALYIATEKGHLDFALKLMNAGADPNGNEFSHNQPLHAAIELVNYAAIVKEMVSRDVNPKIAINAKTAFIDLLLEGEANPTDFVATLLERGADPNRRDKHGRNSLHVAAWYGEKAFVEMLVRYEAVIDAVTNSDKPDSGEGHFSETPLHIAAGKDHVDFVKKLLEHGADPNFKKGYEGKTALHIAPGKSHSKEMIEALLNKGADPNIRNDAYVPPLYYAATRKDLASVEALIKGGADPNARYPDKPKYGSFVSIENSYIRPTLLHILAQSSGYNAGMIETLIKFGADPDIPTLGGAQVSPLHKAVDNDSLYQEAVKELLENGADPDVQDFFGKTPLHIAARKCKRKREDAIALLEHNADLTLRFFNKTPLEYSIDYGCNEVERAIHRHRRK